MTDSHTSLNQTTLSRQQSSTQTIFKPDQKVYIYGDTNYTGQLIRPLERTYPQKWTVQLDAGGHEAVNLSDLSLIDSPPTTNHSSPNAEIPLSEESQANTLQLQQEIIALKRSVQQLEQENEILKKDLGIAKQVIRRAKDITPIVRLSLKRVLRLAHDACMDVQRTIGGWILRMGKLARKFRRLADIWDILSQDEWYLSDIFAPDKLVSVDLIQPERPRKRPTPPEKQTFPLISREEVLRRRRMGMPKCC
ncbi:MAG: hypothetical protein AAF298_26775 [Cyanobacteria bacterium P01_A01_bin.40]